MRIAIVGAGPAGLEAGLLAAVTGHEFTIYESREVGASLLEWGSTRFFSPFRMNVSARALGVLGPHALDPEALPTGPEFAQKVLRPLAEAEPLRGRVLERSRVMGVARQRMLRRDYPGHPIRGETPFLLHIARASGEEFVEADVVIDATGVYGTPNPVGPHGLKAAGETALSARIIRTLGELHRLRGALDGRAVLVVGHAHSAASALDVLKGLSPETQITWVTRSSSRRPVVSIAKDPLPERARIVDQANWLAENPPANLHICRRAHVMRLEPSGERVSVTLSNGQPRTVDAIVSMTGYRGDLSFLSELALDLAPDSEGPSRLTRAVCGVKDCLSKPVVSNEDLLTGEPGFYFAGHKSYGRLSSFLLASGLDQLERIFSIIGPADGVERA